MNVYCGYGRLRKLSSNPGALRSREVEGFFTGPPIAGMSFVIVADPLQNKKALGRKVVTSVVVEVELTNNGFRFETLNSLYQLDVIDNVKLLPSGLAKVLAITLSN